MLTNHIYLIYMYKQDLALNNQQWLMCHCCIAIIIMISITTVIQYIHKHKTQADSVVSGTNGLLISWLLGSWRHEERDTILTMLTPPQRTAQLVMFKISVVRGSKNPTTFFNGQNSTLNSRIPNSRLNAPISTNSFSKSSNSQDHLFRARRHPHSGPNSCPGVYYDNGDCHILCARA